MIYCRSQSNSKLEECWRHFGVCGGLLCYPAEDLLSPVHLHEWCQSVGGKVWQDQKQFSLPYWFIVPADMYSLVGYCYWSGYFMLKYSLFVELLTWSILTALRSAGCLRTLCGSLVCRSPFQEWFIYDWICCNSIPVVLCWLLPVFRASLNWYYVLVKYLALTLYAAMIKHHDTCLNNIHTVYVYQ